MSKKVSLNLNILDLMKSCGNLYGNPSICNGQNLPLSLGVANQRKAISMVGYNKIKNLWDFENKYWKFFKSMQVNIIPPPMLFSIH
jgi:hypothetical protein